MTDTNARRFSLGSKPAYRDEISFICDMVLEIFGFVPELNALETNGPKVSGAIKLKTFPRHSSHSRESEAVTFYSSRGGLQKTVQFIIYER